MRLHHHCSCDVIGTNAASKRFMAIELELAEVCGGSSLESYCGDTRPVCRLGWCTVAGGLR